MNRIRMKRTGLLMALVMLITVSSCDLFDLDINKDPNNPAQASLSLLLTNVELNASSTFAGGLNNSTMGFVGLTTSSDDYNMTNSSWNGTWNYLYSNPLKDLQGIIDATAQQRADGAPNPYYEGIAKVLKAYYFSMMVDLWGDVPYSEAFKGDATEQNLTPLFDDDATIYADLIALCDQARDHFQTETSPVGITGDVIYGGSLTNIKNRWSAVANSLKLRLLLQMSKTDPVGIKNQIEAMLSTPPAGGFITAASGDFQFTFGRLNNPDDRHPMYQSGYAGGAGSTGYTYFGHQLMYEMLLNRDPRRRFYFKPQTSATLDPSDPTAKQTIPCSQRTDCVYGYLALNSGTKDVWAELAAAGVMSNPPSVSQKATLAGLFGRDRADPSGIPNDTDKRANVSVYPAGGLYDDGPELGGGNKGFGNGIFPMITTWMVKLYQIEAVLALGVTGPNARTLFQTAMQEQFAKVNTIGALDPDAVAITNANRDTYINARLAEYDAAIAVSNSAALSVVMKQAWFMNFGNGFELYNAFRRTNLPNMFGLQTPLQLPRQFALRLPYAQDEINLNPNTPSITYDSPSAAVFWDDVPFQF